MRVTNGMMRTNSMLNMQKNKIAYDKYLQQYSSQKKIQRPSDDPTIAVRALKYRTTLVEVEQYQRNIDDATSWMDATETAIKDVDKVLDNMVEYVTQAATGTVNAKDRADIAKQLDQYQQYIYEQDMNSDYAGRYLFTGYRTDTPLLFDVYEPDTAYTINQFIGTDEFVKVNVVAGEQVYVDGNTASQYAANPSHYVEMYKFPLAYQDIVNSATTTGLSAPKMQRESDGQNVPLLCVTTEDLKNANYDLSSLAGTLYPGSDLDHPSGNIVVNTDTGEVLLDKKQMEYFRDKNDLMISYDKQGFDKNEIRPEHYFVCEKKELDEHGDFKTTAKYNRYGGVYGDSTPPDMYKDNSYISQEIKYQINFSQTITVNTEARNAVGTEIKRGIYDIKNLCNDLDVIEANMADVDKRIAACDEGTEAEKIKDLTELKTQIQTQMDLQKSVLVKALGSMITTIQGAKDKINVALADHGSRYNRMVMTKNKIEELELDTNQAKSDNEDADLGEAYINFTESNLLYQATLNATSKVLGQSLLDFI